ncbi:hypothetical protein HMPREF9436_03353 [Faecalibacterium cf. prausnitzii KLE1255]|uniref:Uncharacterized protein n=1 Tax=Faecalibacterium cf. prausnitzii KLE1255 TaxID=748224 RepID=E2ZNS2_9FIRM|nr:hypothetical protein HMPREF9436_03353 [Faecalibacterium cf. prausnitzii KLE1255]
MSCRNAVCRAICRSEHHRMTSDLNDILTALHKPLHPAFCRCSINPASIHTADCYGRRNRGQHCEKRKLFDFNHGAPPTL